MNAFIRILPLSLLLLLGTQAQEPNCGNVGTWFMCGADKCVRTDNGGIAACVNDECIINTTSPFYNITFNLGGQDGVDEAFEEACTDPINACGDSYCNDGHVCFEDKCVVENVDVISCDSDYCTSTEACRFGGSNDGKECVSIADQCASYPDTKTACEDPTNFSYLDPDCTNPDSCQFSGFAKDICNIDCNPVSPTSAPSSAWKNGYFVAGTFSVLALVGHL